VAGTGTREDPWKLKTPPGTSEYEMYRDDSADSPALVCQVGSTKLSGGSYGVRKGYRGRFGMYLPPLLEVLALAELTHDARNNGMRAL
jgi:hypothetical protein